MIKSALFEYQIFQLGTNRANFFSIYPRIDRHLFEITKRFKLLLNIRNGFQLSFNKKETKNLDQQATVNRSLINLQMTSEASCSYSNSR